MTGNVISTGKNGLSSPSDPFTIVKSHGAVELRSSTRTSPSSRWGGAWCAPVDKMEGAYQRQNSNMFRKIKHSRMFEKKTENRPQLGNR